MPLLGARQPLATLAIPVLELGVATAKREDGIRKTLAGSVGGVDTYQNRAVGTAFNIPGVRFHT